MIIKKPRKKTRKSRTSKKLIYYSNSITATPYSSVLQHKPGCASTMNEEFARDFAYFNPTLSCPSLQQPSMRRQANRFGTNHASQSCEYQSTAPSDYQNASRYYELAVPQAGISSNVPIPNQLQSEPYDTLRSEVSCVGLGERNVLSHPKRSRTVFQPHQLRRLQYEFERDMYMVGMKRRNLSKELDLSEKQIKIWFQNRRMKERREHDRRRHRSFGNQLQNGCSIARRVLCDEFGGGAPEAPLNMSNSCTMNNPAQMLML